MKTHYDIIKKLFETQYGLESNKKFEYMCNHPSLFALEASVPTSLRTALPCIHNWLHYGREIVKIKFPFSVRTDDKIQLPKEFAIYINLDYSQRPSVPYNVFEDGKHIMGAYMYSLAGNNILNPVVCLCFISVASYVESFDDFLAYVMTFSTKVVKELSANPEDFAKVVETNEFYQAAEARMKKFFEDPTVVEAPYNDAVYFSLRTIFQHFDFTNINK